MRKNNKGFGAIEIIIILLILGAIGFAGWTVLKNQDKQTNTSTEVSKSDQAQETSSSNTSNSASNNAADAERRADITSIVTGLEIYHNDNGYYPERAIDDGKLYNVEADAFVDPNGNELYSQGSDYIYTPANCESTNGQCNSYALEAKLSDGTTFKKESLNQ